MIENEKTYSKFGYYALDLTKGSNKYVVVKCDYCNELCEKTYKIRNKQLLELNKDCCNLCKGKKREELLFIKYGITNVFQRDDVKEKIKESCLDKYGVEAHTQSDNFKMKREKTMLNKYGTVHSMQVKEAKDKARKTNLLRYGCEIPSKLDQFKEKSKQTYLKKYGVDHYAKSALAKEKFKNRSVDTYGVENPFQSEVVKEKSRKTNLLKYGHVHHLKDKLRALENGKKSLSTKIKDGKVKTYNGKTINQHSEESDFSKTRFRILVYTHGFDKAVTLNKSTSSIESYIEDYLKSLDIEFSKGVRILNGVSFYVPDFIIEDRKVIIECDGLYWHSDAMCENNNYHVEKRNFYSSLGYSPLFFREDELNDKLDIVKSIINNRLKLNSRINGRQTVAGQVERNISREFFKSNHLMGVGLGDTVGLFSGGKLVSALQYRRLVGNEFEVSRFCNSLNTSVIGAYSKLLKYFLNLVKPSKVTNYVDRRYGGGEYLTNFGFKMEKTYRSFRWTDTRKTYHRMQFPGNSGYEEGLHKIWDCGQTKYTLCIT